MHIAFGDFQVSNWAAEVEARTIGASVHQPALAAGRHPALEPLWNIPAIPAGTYTGRAMAHQLVSTNTRTASRHIGVTSNSASRN